MFVGDMHKLLRTLVLFHYEEKAASLQRSYDDLLKVIERSLAEIWDPEQEQSAASNLPVSWIVRLNLQILKGYEFIVIEWVFVVNCIPRKVCLSVESQYNEYLCLMIMQFVLQAFGPDSTANTIALAMQQGKAPNSDLPQGLLLPLYSLYFSNCGIIYC